MQILKRIGLMLLWLTGPVFVFAAANKNDPYLISLRGPGNVVLAAASIMAAVILIRGGYWRRRIAGRLLILLWCLPTVSMLAAHVRSSGASETFCKPTSRRPEVLAGISWWDTRHSPKWLCWPRRG